MLHHTGRQRSFMHNMRLAVLLSLNAGFINASGYMAFSVLTTNVTGHAALLGVNTALSNWHSVSVVTLWLFLFLLGAFISSLYIKTVGRNKSYAYTVPIVIIILICLIVAVCGPYYNHHLAEREYFAGSLLFGMGMQNALVSVISGSLVRTTHLTGMFTDLAIDLSYLVNPLGKKTAVLVRRISLRVAIIFFFLAGGVCGGLLFLQVRYAAFYVPVSLLIMVLFYDYFRSSVSRILTHIKLAPPP